MKIRIPKKLTEVLIADDGIDIPLSDYDEVSVQNNVEHIPSMSSKWNLSMLCPIHKKGEPAICGNYRWVSLLIFFVPDFVKCAICQTEADCQQPNLTLLVRL